MVKWLLEKDVFQEGVDELVRTISDQGMACKVVQYIPFDKESSHSHYDDQDCVVFYGSLNFARVLQRNAAWIPGVYYTVNNFNCSTYYVHFGRYHVNGEYVMLPFGDLSRRRDFLFDTLGEQGTVFIRPDSGSKQFTGQTASVENWESDLKLMGFYDVPDNLMVVVSSPTNIVEEYRFFIVDDEIVAGSQYMSNGKHEERMIDTSSCVPPLNYARTILDEVGWRPDRAFVLDVCKTKGGDLRLLEIGCFSCAGMYAADKGPIVRAVSKIAAEEWNDINGI
jgi:hypothetical protein